MESIRKKSHKVLFIRTVLLQKCEYQVAFFHSLLGKFYICEILVEKDFYSTIFNGKKEPQVMKTIPDPHQSIWHYHIQLTTKYCAIPPTHYYVTHLMLRQTSAPCPL